MLLAGLVYAVPLMDAIPDFSPRVDCTKKTIQTKTLNWSLLILVTSDTRRIRYFVGGIPGSQGDSLAFRSCSWHAAIYDEDVTARPLSAREFILGDAGFALTVFLVRCHCATRM
eukprot:TRINITY_DN20296_c0_g1_i1.p1 TRINITY_DN20296_c0_g1~~TRINITY_DN20296_c0_g1_i1.p1  ORF type:complete len:114 (-),score=0.87 TRINITY_DN20296_c0_g1_i1:38-379(-)